MKRPLPPEFTRVPLAHRGLHDITDGRPENSRASVRAAIAAGYGIEIDLQRSADDQAIVFHDYKLSRLAHAEGTVQDHSAAALSGIPLRGGDEGIPELSEILEIVGGQVPLLIEIKDQDGEMGPAIGPLEESVARALVGYRGPVAVMSFNPYSVMRMAELAPDIPRGLVTGAYRVAEEQLPEAVCARLRDIPDFDRADCSFISHDRTDLDRPRVAELKKSGATILCWTVKSPEQEKEARKVAENITFERYLAAFPS